MANYNLFIPEIIRAEGGFQKLPSDTGNYNSRGELVGTNYGISAKTFERVYGFPPTEADMRNITQAQAIDIFKRLYWDKIKGDYIKSQAVAETLADHAINAGVGTAGRLIQKALNKLGYKVTVDGAIGPQTLSAINQANEKKLFTEFNNLRRHYYSGLSNFYRWGRIWFNRVKALEQKHLAFLMDNKKYILIILAVFLLIGLFIFSKKTMFT